MICSIKYLENWPKLVINKHLQQPVWKGEVLWDWKRTNLVEKEDRENYSPAALTANPKATWDIDKLFQSTRKIKGRQAAASVDLPRTNPVKCKWSRFERSGHCSARAAAGGGSRGSRSGTERAARRGTGLGAMEEQRQDAGTEYRGQAARDPDEFSVQLASRVISARDRAFGHTWNVKV